MKIAQFNAMLLGARTNIEKHAAGGCVAPSLLEWSRNLLAGNPKPKTTQTRLRQDEVVALFEDPANYVTRQQILASIIGMKPHTADTTLKTMVENGTLHPLKHLNGSRYFLSPEARSAGDLVAAKELAASEREKKDRRRMKDRLRDRPSRSAIATKSEKKSLTVSSKRARSAPKPQGDAIIPPGLVIEVCPGYEDTRFKVKGPIVGGFLSEFHSLRGMKDPTCDGSN